MTAAGIKDLIHTLETELKSFRSDSEPPGDADWEPPNLDRIKRKMRLVSTL